MATKTVPTELALQNAVGVYLQKRENYRKALAAVETIEDAEIRQLLRRALTAHVRGECRGISSKYTKQIRCQFSAVPKGYVEKTEIEHAIPLCLIHDRILGISQNGEVDPITSKMYSTHEAVEYLVQNFIIGVEVTPSQHRLLPKKGMHADWQWLINHPTWSWMEISASGWNHAERPKWLQDFMGRYENVAAPHGPIAYWPIETSDSARL